MRFFQNVKTALHSHLNWSLLILAFLFALLSCLLFSTSTSPLYPANNADLIALDSNLFLYEAKLWLQGKTPYLDFYDHKGLYHVAIDVIGISLFGGRYGVFFLQILFDTASLYGLFMTFALFRKDGMIPLLSGIFFLFFYAMGAGGNNEAEWILPFVSWAFYAETRAIIEGRLLYFRLGAFLAGLEMGFSLNSRPLDGLWGGAILIAYFVYYLVHKSGIELLYEALFVLLGCGIPFAIFLPIASSGGYLNLMFTSIFVDSLAYVKYDSEPLMRWLNRLLLLAFFAMALLLYLFEKKNGSKDIASFYFVSADVALVLYFVVARYTSYYWSGYTFFLLNAGYALSLCPSFFKGHPWTQKALYSTISSFVVIWFTILVSLYYTVGWHSFSYSSSKKIQEAVVSLIDEDERTTPGKVYAIDCDAALYTDGNIVVNNRYFVNQSHWAEFHPEAKASVDDYLSSSSRPDYVIFNRRDEITEANFGTIVRLYYTEVAGSLEASGGAFILYKAK